MTPTTNGTTKKIIASVIAGLILMSAGALLNSALGAGGRLQSGVQENSRRISLIEQRLEQLSNAIGENRGALEKNRDELSEQIEKNRIENRDEHKEILGKLDHVISSVNGRR